MPFSIQAIGIIFQENPGEAVNGPEGPPQVMGDGIGKTFQLLVGRLQLGRAPLHPLFQFFIELVDFFLGLFPARDVMEGKDQKIHLPGVVQYRHQGPIPVSHPPFRVVGEDEGLGHGLVRYLGFHHLGEDGLVFLVGIKGEMVAAREFRDVALTGLGIGLIHPDEVELLVQENQGGDGVGKEGFQGAGLFLEDFSACFRSVMSMPSSRTRGAPSLSAKG